MTPAQPQAESAGEPGGVKIGPGQAAHENGGGLMPLNQVIQLSGDDLHIHVAGRIRHAEKSDGVFAVIQDQYLFRCRAAFVLAFGEGFELIEQGAADNTAGQRRNSELPLWSQ